MERSYSIVHELVHPGLHLNNNIYYNKSIKNFSIRNKNVHQRYTAAEKKACDFL